MHHTALRSMKAEHIMTSALHSNSPPVRIWTFRTEGIDETHVNGWRRILDPIENARADRFVFARDRIQYLAAHAVTRQALSVLTPGVPPSAWRFIAEPNHKPVARVRERPAPISFNLSHTNGMVGVAAVACPRIQIGFDLEALDRRVPLEIANRYFREKEVAWLTSLPMADQPDGFLRLWTLKEAFIKATGEGLSRDLASFWFEMNPPRIQFVPGSVEATAAWHFQQRIISDRFIAAVGLCDIDAASAIVWTEIDLNKDADDCLRLR